jgi:hypothetical protein
MARLGALSSLLIEPFQSIIRVRNSSPERTPTGSPKREGPVHLGGANCNGPKKVPAVFDGSRESPSRNVGHLSMSDAVKRKVISFHGKDQQQEGNPWMMLVALP